MLLRTPGCSTIRVNVRLVYTRVEAMAGANRLVGFSCHALREACYSEFAERLVLGEYDMLIGRPTEVMPLLYQFLGEEPLSHNFDNVEYDAPRFDAQLGVDGLHRVHKKVEPRPRETILPPDLFERHAQLAFWRDLPDSKAFRIVADQSAEQQQHTMPESTQKIESPKEDVKVSE